MNRRPEPTPLAVFTCPLEGSTLIEASAGTGKTWNLCGLYLRLLLERQLSVQEILVVTFTNAATAELRERIRGRLAETFDHLRGAATTTADPFVAELLQAMRSRHGLEDAAMCVAVDQALQSFDEAAIFTIHGFCQRALAEMPFASGAPMDLELVADDVELRLEAIHDAWRRHLAGDALAPALARHLLSCNDTPARHAELLRKLLAKPLAEVIWPSALGEGAAALPALETAPLAALHNEASGLWRRDRDDIVQRVADARPLSLHKGKYKDGVIEAARADWDTYLRSADATAVPGPGSLRFLASRAMAPNKGRPPVRPHPFYDLAQALVDGHEAHRRSAALSRLAVLRTLLGEAAVALRAAKRARRVIAFDDMLWNVHERLAGASGAGFAAALRRRYPAALIDEFQDTDPLQLAIFKAIYSGTGAPLILVGDPKQAIFSFRNADLHTYLEAQAEAAALHTLTANQRSTAGMLAALNAVFAANPHPFMLPELAYRPVELGAKPRPPLADRSGESRAPLQLWTLPADAATGLPLPKERARQAAAEATAAEIARLLAASRTGRIDIAGRALAGGDIAVLVRTHAQGETMRAALAALGVASVQLSDASLFASREAEELERVLAAVLEPTREPALRAALASEAIGLDAAAIDALAGDEARLLGFIGRFAGYRERWQQRGIGAALRALFAGEGVTARLLARPDGERRMTNLRHLAELLQQAAERQPAPAALLRWLGEQRTTIRIDEAHQLRLESDRNLVQIVTIYKAKGLEYGLVFCPFLWDGYAPGRDDSADLHEYHDEAHRPVLDFRCGDEGEAAREPFEAQLAVERASEDLRLVYVALTRAVHRSAVVVGTYADGWGSTGESSRALLNWLAAGAGLTPAQWLKGKPAAESIGQAWQALAERAAQAIALAPLPGGPGVPLGADAAETIDLAALPPPRFIASAWRIGSYSSLAQGARHEGAALDHDLRTTLGEDDAAGDQAAAAAVPTDDVLRFPRGTEAGQSIHAVFENVDFGDPATWPLAIDAALRGRPRQRLEAGPPPLRAMLEGMLADVVATPLQLPASETPADTRLDVAAGPARRATAFTLADVRREQRLVELEFNLPAGKVGAVALAEVMRRHGYPVPAFGFGVLDGYLRGFIDLVFEHGGRFHIADWKSNHLGSSAEAYGHDGMAAAMQAHGYHLQYLLYAVAVDRYLAQRIEGYRYDEHFGAVFYLFVRGVRPAWRQADGTPAGVYAHRPSRAAVDELSALFAGAWVAA